MKIKRGNVEHPQIIALLEEHLSDMYATSPADSVHALDIDRLKTNDIHFFSGWFNHSLAGCIALKCLNDREAEIKSMRTAIGHRGKGVASQLLEHVSDFATRQGIEMLYLETGTHDYFLPARTFYKKQGFHYCQPFAQYENDPNSCFMVKGLGN
ncbi:GNAT family N-acetyltransferase [Aestuariibacter sp. AA17]|uniref:GNAT family N-acetyltransferase n=1 Tax=Fluctibacter corallii TaxID=2984329 RepID=A0ABT3A8H0_9ALTE|nr:GNAT family N-acetyltransferase [Aestuariibacter sp. AA17]MCV2884874.1 GNAT family N-acetyltransferase [Aestuariibacter sp. AA17]